MNQKFVRTALAAAVGLALLGNARADDVSADVLQQISAIQQTKASFSAGQKKMDSDLAFGLLKAAGDSRVGAYTNAVKPLATTDVGGTPQDQGASGGDPGYATVEIYGATDAISGAVTAAGGTVVDSQPSFGVVMARLPVGAIAGIADRADVTRVASPAIAATNVGALTSQGYISHESNRVISTFGINGAGVKVGVLSDSASAARIAALKASGDLPAGATVLPGQAGSGTDEGTAMMEIVYDIAPGSTPIFATAFTSAASFAANIIALANAGCKVIVDDVSYFNEAAFQDGPIAQAVNTVTAMGVTYFSSAGNSGNLTNNTSGTWQGDFLSGGPVTGAIATAGETGLVHNFGTAGSPQNFDVYTAVTTAPTYLKWSDPLGGSANDYDLFLLNSTGTTLKAFSAATQSGTQDPVEAFSCNNTTTPSLSCVAGDRIVVVLFSGSPRAMQISTNRGRLSIGTDGATFGHNAAASTVTMAATYWNSAKTGTKPFTGFPNVNETFSSDGPRKIFYTPTGTAITPGNFLFGTNGGTTLTKPNFAAADGVSTKTPGFLPFYGTSAAAPHAAGIAALILQARPGYTPAQVRAALAAGAMDSMAVGTDRDSGLGVLSAYKAVQFAIANP